MKKLLSMLLITVFAILPLLAITVSAEIPYDNVISLYNMEGTNLTNAITGANGTLMNGASFGSETGRTGKVLILNNDDVTAPGQGLGYDMEGQHAIMAESGIPDSDAMTISVWYKSKEDRTWARLLDLGDANAQNLLAEGATDTVQSNRFICIAPSNGSNFIATVNWNDGNPYGLPNSRDRVFGELAPKEQWVHLVFVMEPGKPNTLYLNGEVVGESTTGGGSSDPAEVASITPRDILDSPAGIGNGFIGRSRHENNGDMVFNGWVDDLVIFDVALTAAQVKELGSVNFNAGIPGGEASAPEAGDSGTGGSSAPATGDTFALIALLAAVSLGGAVTLKKAVANK